MTPDKKCFVDRKHYWRMIVVAFFALLLIGLIGSLMTYRIILEVDVGSGMKRERVEVLGITIDSKVTDTRFSRFIKGSVGIKNMASWRTESVYYSPFLRRPSPHFIYHGALQSLDSLMDAFEVADTDELRKQELAQQALLHLQKGEMFTVQLDHSGDIELRVTD